MSSTKAAFLNGLKLPLQLDSLELDQSLPNVDLRFAALNHRDWWITQGLYPGIQYPTVLGSDGSGVYEGKNVLFNPSLLWGNDERFPSNNYHILGLEQKGTLAQKLAIQKENIYDVPVNLTMEEAAALPLAGLTAYRALITKCQAKKGQNVLITGIGGGVAQMAAKFAVALGANVFVTSSSEEKIQLAKEFGVVDGYNYKDPTWTKQLKKNHGRMDAIVDGAGGSGFKDLISTCEMGATIAVYGGTAGKIGDINPAHIFFKQIAIKGSTMGSDLEFAQMLSFVEEHKVKPEIDKVFPLSQINDAFTHMKSGSIFGKIVIDVNK